MLAVGHVLRYDAHAIMIRDIIRSGELGQVVNIQHLEPVSSSINLCINYFVTNMSLLELSESSPVSSSNWECYHWVYRKRDYLIRQSPFTYFNSLVEWFRLNFGAAPLGLQILAPRKSFCN